MITIACSAPYGVAGLGQHLAQVVEETRADGSLGCYYAPAVRPDDPAGRVLEGPAAGRWFQYTPLRFSPGWKSYLLGDLFDRRVAAALTRGESFHGFNGQALRSFERARQLGHGRMVLESATA